MAVKRTEKSSLTTDQLASQCCCLPSYYCKKIYAKFMQFSKLPTQAEPVTYSLVTLPVISHSRLLVVLQSHDAPIFLSGHVLLASKQPWRNAPTATRASPTPSKSTAITPRTKCAQRRIQRWLITHAHSHGLAKREDCILAACDRKPQTSARDKQLRRSYTTQ